MKSKTDTTMAIRPNLMKSQRDTTMAIRPNLMKSQRDTIMAIRPNLMKEVYGTMALDTTKLYTTKDIEALPEGVRAELIDGQIYYMATPNSIHQALLAELSYAFLHYQKESGKKCRTYFAPYSVFINRDEYNYLEPDLLIICPHGEDDDRHQKDGCHGGPDFVLEIVSPSSKRMDYLKKLEKYDAAGVREYWIVDPQTERILVYDFNKENLLTQYTFEDKIPVGIYGDLSIDFTEIMDAISL